MDRNIYQNLLSWKNSAPRKPLILKGARQTGKTYILRQFGEREFKRLHYCNFQQDKKIHQCFADDLLPETILQLLSFSLDTVIDRKNDLLFFDEIQDCPRALTSLKYFFEQLPDIAICCAGSLLGVVHSNEPFPVGAVTFLDLYPLSFDEYLLAADPKSHEFIHGLTLRSNIPEVIHRHLLGLLKNYFVVGGMPEAVMRYLNASAEPFEAFALARKVQKDLIIGSMGDFAKYAHTANAREITVVYESVPSQLSRLGGKFRPSDVIAGARFGRLRSAVDWLAGAGIVHKVFIANSGELPFSAFTKENTFKLYMADIGLMGALADISPKTVALGSDLFATFKGAFCENFVAQEFFAAGVGPLFAWKCNTAEIEFMREINGAVAPIEVKSGLSGKLKSLAVFADRYKSDYSVRISAHNLAINEQSRFHSYPLYLAGRFPLPEK
jgi:predicted AAA+ superfamily ATPase